ncbi:MAG: PfkB family carbohydrate kinase [Bacteroidota bacterium]|nr:PfkB family carbohydrate kinase [Bacteroidota bacterium]
MSMLAIGTVGLDYIETPDLSASGVLGGTLTFIALAARHFSSRIGLVAVIGRDFSDEHWAWFRDPAFDRSGVQIEKNLDTFAWGARYDATLNDRVTLYTHINALEAFEPRVPEAYRGPGVVALGNLDPNNQLKTLNQLSPSAYIVCDTMNLWMNTALEQVHEVIARVDCLIINDSEARQLGESSNLISAAHRILGMGPRVLVIKKAEHGAQLFAEGGVFCVPAVPLASIVDPTGAGDAFLGGFAGSLSAAGSHGFEALQRAVVYGTVMASFCVEELGPGRLSQVEAAEIRERCAILKVMMEFPDMGGQ